VDAELETGPLICALMRRLDAARAQGRDENAPLVRALEGLIADLEAGRALEWLENP
jgi:hypothetical protein